MRGLTRCEGGRADVHAKGGSVIATERKSEKTKEPLYPLAQGYVFPNKPRSIADRFQKHGPLAVDLLDKLYEEAGAPPLTLQRD